MSLYDQVPLRHDTSTNIRLLKLLPSRDVPALDSEIADIALELQVIALVDATSFTALSYVWGDTKASHKISVNGQSVMIRGNLWSFLSEAQSRRATDLLWIDALCIDQTNASERKHQVGLMGQIYSYAKMVIVWLGVGPQELVVALAYVKDTDHVVLKAQQVRNWLTHVKTICQAQYWTRAWIAQEFLRAKRITFWCGGIARDSVLVHRGAKDSRSWEVSNARKSLMPSVDDKSMALRLLRLRHDSSKYYMYDIGELLQEFHEMECSNTRDRIYAYLSLLDRKELEHWPIPADYTITTSQLFAQLMSRKMSQLIQSAQQDATSAWALFVEKPAQRINDAMALGKWKWQLLQHLKLSEDDPVVTAACDSLQVWDGCNLVRPDPRWMSEDQAFSNLNIRPHDYRRILGQSRG